jgi:hypothetical protein
MASTRVGMATAAGLVVLGAVGWLAQPAAALHGGAIADCGDAGIFTFRTVETGAGTQSPPWGDVLLLEGGGTLAPQVVVIDGEVAWDDASVGLANNAVEEVTCSFTLANGLRVDATGVFTRR